MIKTVVVDLGGVFFEAGTGIALQRIYKIVSVSKEKVDEIFEGHPKKEGWLYRKGKISKEEFWKSAIEKLKINKEMVPKLQEIWHSSYKPIKGMKELVSDLRKSYRVIAFSGNVKERIEYLNEEYSLNEDFDDFILSFDIGSTKLEIEFYRILLKKIRCRPEECVFIDDTQEFLDTARSFQMEAILFQNPEQLRSDLRKIGVKF